ncbi:MAG: hypothetical protein ABUJ93_11420, partial [Hyphomicrobium sp.]
MTHRQRDREIGLTGGPEDILARPVESEDRLGQRRWDRRESVNLQLLEQRFFERSLIMMSPDQLIALSKKGRHIRVAKDTSDNRRIVIADRRRRAERSIEIPPEHYENLMEETVA